MWSWQVTRHEQEIFERREKPHFGRKIGRELSLISYTQLFCREESFLMIHEVDFNIVFCFYKKIYYYFLRTTFRKGPTNSNRTMAIQA